MDIGKNIVRLRNEKGYTQEALASLLHVSCAAISKWEHGSSCPDISTLPILARIFDISIDELLNFEKNLSEEDVKKLCEEILQQFQTASFKQAMEYVQGILRQYPNSEDLKLSIARMYMQILMLIQEEEKITEFLTLAKGLAEDVAHSADLEKKQLAGVLTVNFMTMEQRYEEGLKVLQELPKLADTSSLECSLAMRIKDEEEAKHMLQAQLFSYYNQMGMILLNMCELAKRHHHKEELSRCLDLIEALNQHFQFPMSITTQLFIYTAELQDEQRTLRYLKEYIEQLKVMDQLKQQRQMQLQSNPWFDHVQLSSTSLPKGIMQNYMKEVLEEMAQQKQLRFDSAQELLKSELEQLS